MCDTTKLPDESDILSIYQSTICDILSKCRFANNDLNMGKVGNKFRKAFDLDDNLTNLRVQFVIDMYYRNQISFDVLVAIGLKKKNTSIRLAGRFHLYLSSVDHIDPERERCFFPNPGGLGLRFPVYIILKSICEFHHNTEFSIYFLEKIKQRISDGLLKMESSSLYSHETMSKLRDLTEKKFNVCQDPYDYIEEVHNFITQETSSDFSICYSCQWW